MKDGMPDPLSYVVITPARNEAGYLESTILSVAAQTVLPSKWVIVSDGSTDGTDDIARRYAAQYSWIDFLRTPERKERHFAGKVNAIRSGCERLKGLDYDVVASLDADTTFEPDFFAFLLDKLAADPSLGLVGTRFVESDSEPYDYNYVSIEHVSGPCQVFRRACFEAIGGYVPSKVGGVDTIAVIASRMKGWKTRTFTEKAYTHHRAMGTAGRSLVSARFRLGAKDYHLGNHPLWQLFRCAYQLTKRPYIVGGIALGAGYVRASIQHPARPVSSDFIAFTRRDQIRRLRNLFALRASR